MSTRVINHLQESLDFKVQDEVTRNLFGVYSFLYSKITKATISKSEADIEAIVEFLRDLRSTWSEAVKIHQQKHPIAQ
jgi:flagellar biosynthetic protein FliS